MEFLDPSEFRPAKKGPKPRPFTILVNRAAVLIPKRVVEASADPTKPYLNLYNTKLELYIADGGELIIKPGEKGFNCSEMKTGDIRICNVNLCTYLWDKYKWSGKSAKLLANFSEHGTLEVITRQIIAKKDGKN